jgi:hypothetical protein
MTYSTTVATSNCRLSTRGGSIYCLKITSYTLSTPSYFPLWLTSCCDVIAPNDTYLQSRYASSEQAAASCTIIIKQWPVHNEIFICFLTTELGHINNNHKNDFSAQGSIHKELNNFWSSSNIISIITSKRLKDSHYLNASVSWRNTVWGVNVIQTAQFWSSAGRLVHDDDRSV